MIPDTSLFSELSQKGNFLCFLRFQNVDQIKRKTNTKLIESHPVKMKFVTKLPLKFH